MPRVGKNEAYYTFGINTTENGGNGGFLMVAYMFAAFRRILVAIYTRAL
jgi:hypothetical protein